jgi:hypothetical protein
MLAAKCCGLALAAALSVVSIGRANAAADTAQVIEIVGIQHSVGSQYDVVAQSHLYCLALAIYFEGGSTAETVEGQQYIARVVTARARDRVNKWGGRDICDVVFYKRNGVCQFSFACLPRARQTPRQNPRWDLAVEIARQELANASDLEEQAVRYYMNPELTSDRNACRFRKEFVPVVKAGRHEFFREPTEAERAELLTQQHTACLRHAAALEAAKQKAKALAARKKAAMAKKRAKNARKKYATR